MRKILHLHTICRDYGDDDEDFETIATVGSNVTQYTDTGLASDETYVYQVVAYNEAGDSDPTDNLYITTESDSSACFVGSLDHINGDSRKVAEGLILLALAVCTGRVFLMVFRSDRPCLPR